MHLSDKEEISSSSLDMTTNNKNIMSIKEDLLELKQEKLKEFGISVDTLVDKIFNNIILDIKKQINVSPNLSIFRFNITACLKASYLYDKDGKNVINDRNTLINFYLKLEKKFELENFKVIERHIDKPELTVFFEITL